MFQKLAQAHVARKQTKLPCWLHYQVLPWGEPPGRLACAHCGKERRTVPALKPACWESDRPLNTCITEIVSWWLSLPLE